MDELIKEIIEMKRGDKEFILTYLPVDDDDNPSWWAGIGNEGMPVVLGEMGEAEFNGFGDTPMEALRNLVGAMSRGW